MFFRYKLTDDKLDELLNGKIKVELDKDGKPVV